MALIFTDTLDVTNTTGLYTLQAQIDGTWTDLHSIAGPQNGTISVNESLNTIAVDNTLLPIGQTFRFRWRDSLGNTSNEVAALVPFTLEDYFTVQEAITYTNNGGDSWTFAVPYTPPGTELNDAMWVTINFFTDTSQTVLTDTSGLTADQSYSYSGHGAGTYVISALYTNTSGQHFILSQAYVMVDAAGNVLREAIFSGFTGVSISGMELSATARYSVTNATVDPATTGFIACNDTFSESTRLNSGSVLTHQPLPPYRNIVIYFTIGLVDSEWTANALNGDVRGCLMTLSTNIPS
jgi:hypothetical protein